MVRKNVTEKKLNVTGFNDFVLFISNRLHLNLLSNKLFNWVSPSFPLTSEFLKSNSIDFVNNNFAPAKVIARTKKFN